MTSQFHRLNFWESLLPSAMGGGHLIVAPSLLTDHTGFQGGSELSQ